MIPPIGNLILALLAVLGAYLYPQLPNPPFDSAMFAKILQWILITLAGWNIKAAAVKSALPALGDFFGGEKER